MVRCCQSNEAQAVDPTEEGTWNLELGIPFCLIPCRYVLDTQLNNTLTWKMGHCSMHASNPQGTVSINTATSVHTVDSGGDVAMAFGGWCRGTRTVMKN